MSCAIRIDDETRRAVWAATSEYEPGVGRMFGPGPDSRSAAILLRLLLAQIVAAGRFNHVAWHTAPADMKREALEASS